MPRYFFDAIDGGRARDLRGVELPSHHSARVEAIKLAGRLLADDPDYLWGGQNFRIEVRDADGVHLFTVVTLAISTSAAEMAG